MTERYYCPAARDGSTVTLDGPEAHHLSHVMRAAEGDKVVLFDGEGNECQASVVSVGKREVQLRIELRRVVDREASFKLTLAVAMPKGDRQKWLIEKATELGVARVIPLVTERSVVKLKESGLERLRRVIVEASKQCGRNRLMELSPPQDFGELVSTPAPNEWRFIAHPPSDGYDNFQVRPDNAPTGSAKSILVAIGPEGGFTDEELQRALDAGWHRALLGKRILRVETAALNVAASFLGD